MRIAVRVVPGALRGVFAAHFAGLGYVHGEIFEHIGVGIIMGFGQESGHGHAVLELLY